MPFLPNPILPNPTLPNAWDILPNTDAHFAEKKFGKMGKVGTLRQNGFRQTVPYSDENTWQILSNLSL